MARKPATLVLAGVAAAGTVAAALLALPGTAGALACTGQVAYAPSTNTLKLTAGALDLPQLAALCPSAPLTQTDPTTHTWLLRANLLVTSGATLRVRGAGTGVDAGDEVDNLRLLSRSDNSALDVVNVTAMYGTLDFASTHVTSWDDRAAAGAGAPDVNPSVGTAVPGAGADGIGRAFVRAISYLDPVTHAPRQSRMDITGSDFGYLGYYAAESYGVSYKGRGCDSAHLLVCATLKVLGSQTASRFHNSFMGTYTFDALGMLLDHNEYDHNVMYGLDTHDDSNYLTITNNHSHDNGDHGIICSQRCDHLTITGNESDHNGFPPYVPSGADNVGDSQVHGIMIHRGVNDSTIAGNFVHDNNGAGIAVFDSFSNTISANTITGNLFGIRTSVGSHNNTYRANIISASKLFGINAYPGVKDVAVYGIHDGRPADEVFDANTIDGTGGNLVNLQGTDRFTFTGTRVLGAVGRLAVDSSTGVLWSGASAPGRGVYLTAGRPPSPSGVSVALASDPFTVTPGTGTVTLIGALGRLAQVGGGPYALIRSGIPPGTRPGQGTVPSAQYLLDAATLTGAAVAVTPRPVEVEPSAGGVHARLVGYSAAGPALDLASGPGWNGVTASSVPVTVTWLGATPRTVYYYRVNGGPRHADVAGPGGSLTVGLDVTTRGVQYLTVGTS